MDFAYVRYQKNRLEQERRTAESLRRLDRLKDDFLANTSHELRTPLNGIIGLTESLIDGATGPLPEQTRHNLSMIASSGRRLTNLVNDVLDFSKLKHKDIQLRTKPLDMRSVVEVVLMLSQHLVGNKDVRIVNQIEADLPAADADEDRVQQILYNLVGNAVKFTEAGTVSVSARVENEYLAVTVSDTGIGIPEDKLGSVFESFEQADGSIAREYGGTGLGLAVTRQLTELHSGDIRVESEFEKGSHFTFTLPISKEKAEATEAADIIVKHTRIAELAGKSEEMESIAPDIPAEHFKEEPKEHLYKILIVDDEAVNLQFLANQLSLENYAITRADNGDEALSAIKDQAFDLVLLDVMMPRMSGYEVSGKNTRQMNCPW